MLIRKVAFVILAATALLSADPARAPQSTAPRPSATSEPATFALGGLGFTILWVIRRRRLRKSGQWPPRHHPI